MPHHRIGLVYVPGALPCFEAFGNLPTDLVGADGLVDGKPASEVLDMIIIPGGSLIESGSTNGAVAEEILKMARVGKYVLGICAGFQVLSKKTDVGRLSTIPIFRDGIGLLDAEFTPLICTDQVKATVIGTSFITAETCKQLSGFHCHTYGKIVLGSEAKPIIISHVNRVNYRSAPQDLVSGVANKEGNVVGILTHGLLDHNPAVIDSICKSLNITSNELKEIRATNAKLIRQIKAEIGIATETRPAPTTKKAPKLVMVTAIESGSGKTFLVTGIAGALKKQGFNLGLLKVGGDIRDIVPALYLIKEPILDFSSVEVFGIGWTPLQEAVKKAAEQYDFLLVEGAMSAFTGLLTDGKRPMSTIEVAAGMGASVVVVVACNHGGIEGGMLNALNYITIMKRLGINVTGVILNKAYLPYITKGIRETVDLAFKNVGVKLLGIMPRLQLEERGMIPEIEIRYETFGEKAIEAAEANLNLNGFVDVAQPPCTVEVDYDAFAQKFKKLLTEYNCGSSDSP
ncbi:MAG: AAA family ATPase [Candidatus Bathyarchaeota archaeon]|nr:AAA family ATPase [Candidatus Bathyarchaeota archaeon]